MKIEPKTLRPEEAEELLARVDSLPSPDIEYGMKTDGIHLPVASAHFALLSSNERILLRLIRDLAAALTAKTEG